MGGKWQTIDAEWHTIDAKWNVINAQSHTGIIQRHNGRAHTLSLTKGDKKQSPSEMCKLTPDAMQ